MCEFASINGYRLRYRIRGEGPLAIFGHGLLGSIEQVDQANGVLGELEEQVRLLVYDARGHGQSEGPESPCGYSWEWMGRDMAGFVSHLAEDRAVVGGGSMGSASALWVGLERPDLVKGLILMMPPPIGRPEDRTEEERRALGALDLLSTAICRFGLEATLCLATRMPGFASTPEEACERAALLRTSNPLALRHAIRGLLNSPYRDPCGLAGIRVPALVIAHEGDGLHPVRAARLLSRTIPDSRLVVGPDPGYWRSHPHEFVSEVRGFLGRVC